jgi:hypothetical protein
MALITIHSVHICTWAMARDILMWSWCGASHNITNILHSIWAPYPTKNCLLISSKIIFILNFKWFNLKLSLIILWEGSTTYYLSMLSPCIWIKILDKPNPIHPCTYEIIHAHAISPPANFATCLCPCHITTLAPCPPPPSLPHHAYLLHLCPTFPHFFPLSFITCLFWRNVFGIRPFFLKATWTYVHDL